MCFCDKWLKCIKETKQHIRNLHNKRVKCDFCDREFQSIREMQLHTRKKHNAQEWNRVIIVKPDYKCQKCDFCDKGEGLKNEIAQKKSA